MAAPAGEGHPLSLRPFPVADKKPKTVADFIARVNAQPGGFRSLSEAALREEVARQAQGDGAPDEDDVDMSDGDGDGDGEGDAVDDDDAAAQDPAQARFEVLRNIDMAGNTAMLTLDTLSLLLSKQNPSQASLTLSKQLREVAGIGTLGADRLEETNVTEDKEKDQEAVAIGWTLMEVSKTRDAAEAASAFLQNEVESESRYWEDVVGVQNSGWSICKMPQERHTLGVKFGFDEAAPEFRNSGLAPMRRNEDGSVKLDSGALGGTSERLVVTVEKDGNVVGRSTVAPQTADDAPLEARVLEARNTLFAQELWHELGREARTLTAYDVRLQGTGLIYDMDEKTKVIVELQSLDSAPTSDGTLPENDTAEAISLTLHILLSYAHRHNELMRIRPLPPHIPRSRGQHAYTLFRPIIARVIYLRNLTSTTRYIGALTKTLQKAGLEASFTLRTVQPSIPDAGATKGPNQHSAAQLLVRSMLQPPEFTLALTLLPGISVTIRGHTYLYPVTGTYYYILLPPSSPIETLCPPHKDGYTDLRSLAEYLSTAIDRLLADHFIDKLPGDDWAKNVQGRSIRHTETDKWEILFSVRGDDHPDQNSNNDDDDASIGTSEVPTAPILTLSSLRTVDDRNECKVYTWRGRDEAPAPASLESVVTKIAGAVVQS